MQQSRLPKVPSLASAFMVLAPPLNAPGPVSEIVPAAKRSLYAVQVLCPIISRSPGTLYANWIAVSGWRWISCNIAIWNVQAIVDIET